MHGFSTKTGRRRQTARYRFSIQHRAVAAAAIGEEHGWPTHKVAGLFCVNRAYVACVRRMSEADRLRVLRGDLSLSELVNGRCQLTDAKVDRIVARIGPERILAALDRWTRPTAVAAE